MLNVALPPSLMVPASETAIVGTSSTPTIVTATVAVEVAPDGSVIV
ncbi:hypothetical protein LMG26686_04135 [Achromobacter mucicolens]|nr:hypothetical protein LMG26686_04135 [Achromobacter mucicolens]